MKKRLICWLVLLVLVMAPVGALAESVGVLRYENVKRINASLKISDSTAICTGVLIPQGTQRCTLILTLYKMTNGSWTKVDSWGISTTGGKIAELTKTKTVSRGTYKVVAEGDVAGETSSAESSTVLCG